ncbi:MAG: hypothetical protein GY719_07030 [bacterium]|nr:hypothetical protein [bacterium]
MHLVDLLMKEYETALGIHRARVAAQETVIKIVGSLVLALVTFLLRGDLPKQAYLLAALVYLVGGLWVGALSRKRSSSLASLRISELKLRRWAEAQNEGWSLFDLIDRESYIRSGWPRRKRWARLHRGARLAVLVVVYLLLVRNGIDALNTTPAIKYSAGLLAVALLGFTGVFGWFEHRDLTRRFEQVVSSDGQRVTRVEEFSKADVAPQKGVDVDAHNTSLERPH